MNKIRIIFAAATVLLSTVSWATEPDLRPGDKFVYAAGKNKFTQKYVGKNSVGNHKFQVGSKFFLLSPSMSTITKFLTLLYLHTMANFNSMSKNKAARHKWAPSGKSNTV